MHEKDKLKSNQRERWKCLPSFFREFTQLALEVATAIFEMTFSAFLSREVISFQSLESINRQISSSCERNTILRSLFSLTHLDIEISLFSSRTTHWSDLTMSFHCFRGERLPDLIWHSRKGILRYNSMGHGVHAVGAARGAEVELVAENAHLINLDISMGQFFRTYFRLF